MLDPITASGLVATAISFTQFGAQLFALVREIRSRDTPSAVAELRRVICSWKSQADIVRLQLQELEVQHMLGAEHKVNKIFRIQVFANGDLGSA